MPDDRRGSRPVDAGVTTEPAGSDIGVLFSATCWAKGVPAVESARGRR